MARNPFALAVRAMRSPSAPAGGITTSSLLPAWLDRQPQFHEWDTARAIKEGYKASVWVYACCDAIMKRAASVPWVVQERGDSSWDVVDGHPLSELIENPNEHMSRADLVRRMVAHLLLGGNALLSKVIVRGMPVELWPIDPSLTRPVPSRIDFIDHYEFDRGGEKVPLDPKEIIHLMLPDPANPYWGMGPLQAAARAVDTDVEAVRWNKIAMQNRAVSDGVFAVDQMLTKEQYDGLREQVREQYSGAENARTPWVLGGGTKWYAMSRTPVEMDFVESRKLTREEIAGVFAVPLPLIGAYEHATLANIETAVQILWGDTIVPILTGIGDAFTRGLVGRADRGRLAIKPDLSEVKALREDFTKKVDTLQKLVTSGVPLNAALQRLEMDIEDVPGGDVGLVLATMVPLTMAGEAAGQPGGAIPPKQLGGM